MIFNPANIGQDKLLRKAIHDIYSMYYDLLIYGLHFFQWLKVHSFILKK